MELETDVFFLHYSWGCGDADVSRYEDWLFVAHSAGFEFFQPGIESFVHFFERERRVTFERATEVGFAEVERGEICEALAQLRDPAGGKGKAYGVGVASEAGEEIVAALDGVEEMEVRGRSGPIRRLLLLRGRARALVCRCARRCARRESDDAAVPSVSVDDQAAGLIEMILSSWARISASAAAFGVAAVLIELLQLLRDGEGALRILGGEELDDFGGDVHASGGIDARGEAEAYVDGSELALVGIELGYLHERAQAGVDGTLQFLMPMATKTRFSPSSGTASAMVAMASSLRNDGRSLVRARLRSWLSKSAWESLNATPAPQRCLHGYWHWADWD